jgi:photosystem II stability/assembly factor-like uncharacterized protein
MKAPALLTALVLAAPITPAAAGLAPAGAHSTTHLVPGTPLPARATSQRYAAGDTAAPSPFRGLEWRLVGPFRGGRVDAVTGDPKDPNTFYFGGVDGGVWKTTDAGRSWRNTSDKAGIGSVGAIAVAPSDPNVVYVGGGESDPREDITYGQGMFRSTDAGRMWTPVGLEDTRHIADIVVDPNDPNRVYVAALGHAFGPNAERGVFRSTDGGATWKKVLFLNDSTGAIDLAMDPSNPRVLYAAMWKFERMPWGFSAGGGRSGLWKTTDGGDHWTDLSNTEGFPPGPIGRIGVSVSGADPQRVYASIEAPDSTGGIFRSDDGGRSWHRVNAEQQFMVRPWYFSGVTADPVNADGVWVLNLGTYHSTDGGHAFARVSAPHGDDHILWIDPKNPERMIEGNDGGATISMDGGHTWSTQGNQPTAQFYHVITDNQYPYRIYGAQQDNTTVGILSRSDNGAITTADWYDVGGGEAGYIAPKPGSPDTVFAGNYMGTLTRWVKETGQSRDVSVWLNNWDGYAAADVPYRFQWTFPILFSPDDPNTLYTTAQYVFKSTDDGQTWQKISPDLTRHDPATMGPVGGEITRDMTGTEWYATIFAFAESPVKAGVLWAGSDDGLVHVSTDDGTTWTNVTPKGLPEFARISIIEPSHYDPGTAYLAANHYQQDDLHPYLYRTTDYGRSWTRIDAGIPVGAYTRTIREDPVTRGLLFAGTETGVYVSMDDGAHWRSLQLNLPTVSVRDLAIHDGDLMAATHGRAFWALDDIRPLRRWASTQNKPITLFPPRTAIRFAGFGGGFFRPSAAGQNPPDGVIVDYALASRPAGDVKLEFLDSAGTVIRSFTSKEGQPARPKFRSAAATAARDSVLDERARARIEGLADSASFTPADSIVPKRAGLNRFVWNLRYPDVRRIHGLLNDEGTYDGPLALPGTYTVRLTVGDSSYSQQFTVKEDPRVRVTPEALRAQFDLTVRVRQAADTIAATVARIDELEGRVAEWKRAAAHQSWAARVDSAAAVAHDSLEAVRASLICIHCHAGESSLNYPIQLYNMLLTMNYMVQGAHAAPTDADQKAFQTLSGQLDTQLERMRTVEQGPVARLEALLRQVGASYTGVSS